TGAALEMSIDHPGVAHEDIETAVRAEAQIDRASQTGGKSSGHRRLIRVERLDPAVVEIGEEVPAAVFLWPIEAAGSEGSADDAGRGIVVYRPTEARVAGRAVLDCRPTVVGPGAAFVDFFRPAANVVNKQAAGFGLKGEAERIAQAQGPGGAVLAR